MNVQSKLTARLLAVSFTGHSWTMKISFYHVIFTVENSKNEPANVLLCIGRICNSALLTVAAMSEFRNELRTEVGLTGKFLVP
jgi:hypothetical protein